MTSSQIAAKAVCRVFESTYDLEDGYRICRICGAHQYDYASGHVPGCDVDAALREALEVLKTIHSTDAAPTKGEAMDAAFKFHKLNEQGQAKAQKIAEAFDRLVQEIEPLSKTDRGAREFAVARTKLEEACFFTKKAMAVCPDNQEA